MSQRRPEALDLYAYYGLSRDGIVPKIGSFVCGTPLHVTFAKFQTEKPHIVLETMRDVIASQTERPHMIRDRLALSKSEGRRAKPIVLLHDVAQKLTAMQDETYRAVDSQHIARIAGWTRLSEYWQPHVSLNLLGVDPYVPQEFDIDHVVVTTGIRQERYHWHSFIWDVIPIGEGS